MIQKFNAPCNFGGMTSPFIFWISDEYTVGKDPLYFQKDWLQKVRGGTLDPKISEGIIEIARISEKNKLSFEYLFGIAMNAALEKYNTKQNIENINENEDDKLESEKNKIKYKKDEEDEDEDEEEEDEEEKEDEEEDEEEEDEEDDEEEDEEDDEEEDEEDDEEEDDEEEEDEKKNSIQINFEK